MDLHLFINAFVIGLVEGITEFIPVSSTGHMIIIGHCLGFESDKAKSLEIIIQLGPILAAVLLFRNRLFSLIGMHCIHYPVYQRDNGNHLRLWHIILAMSPSVVIGLILQDEIKMLFKPYTVVFALIVGSFMLLLGDYFRIKKSCTVELDDITYRQAFIVGCFQCLAFWPGFSRSGATISGSMLMGISPFSALEFSFILAVPMMIGTTALELYNSISLFSLVDLQIFTVGFVTSFIVAMMIIKLFLGKMKRIYFTPFAIYRFIVAAFVYFLL
ncbi:undecaprenyl-diphosphate phosphatase [Candidatus Profftia tarda]|uniref:Undecaprenyl-diphosphatase n=1 Tax=Candidatus Profftia tarda TaxID=1177216 RepID=A0A8E4EY59_9ENTR|nr:undecaprenyl-diphosphate phosphatase [Candidatus Profftia tarda]CAD6508844.1 Undecaprenyl-diphosphatase [Candidatus Profftia tarda]